MLGKHHSEETKRKLSVANKGQIPWTKGKPGPMLGKHHTAVTCKRLGDAARGRPQSVATRAKRSASLRQHYAQKCLVENN